MKALKINDTISLFFTTVVDMLTLGIEDEEDFAISVDRKYWENKGTKESLLIADKLLELTKEFTEGYTLKYNKHYIGLAKDGLSKNFISFVPRKEAVILHIKHTVDEEIDKILNDSALDVISYDRKWNQYRIRIKENDIETNRKILVDLINKAYKLYMG